jgi:hypothetical protein
MNRQRGAVTAWLIGALAAVVVGLMVAAILNVLGDQWIAVGSAAITVLGLILAYWQARTVRLDAKERAQELAGQLPAQVVSDWKAELPNRSLDEHGRRMNVWWRLADGSNPDAELAAELGTEGTLGQLIDCLRQDVGRGRQPRLVITGQMGAGKTAACIRLIIELAERDACLPVLIPLAAWDGRTPLTEWMARQLPEVLRIPGTSRYDQQVARMLADRHILPVLDGLDEGRADAARIAAALRSIDSQLRGKPFVLTCRTEDFSHANQGGVLHLATIVELQPMTADEVADVLLKYEPPSVHGPLSQLAAKLRDQPTGPLAEALSTPFMVSLARDTGGRPLAGPEDGQAPDTAEAYRQRLLGAFVAQAYESGVPVAPERALHYFRFLAQHTDRTDQAGRLAWWLLRQEMPRAVFLVANICLAGPASAGMAALFFALFDRPWLGFWIGLVMGVVGALLVELTDQDQPRRARPRLRSKRVPHADDLARIAAFGLTGGLSLAIGAWILYSGARYVVIGGVLAALTFAVGRYLTEPNDPLTALTPDNLLRADRASVWYAWLAGAVPGALIGAYLGFVFHAAHRPAFDSLGILRFPSPTAALIGAAYGALLSGYGVAAMAIGSGAWSRFIVTRLWLARRGLTPVRLMGFLDDAYQRQVLRQANGYYEFRHRTLQRYLAGDGPAVSVGAPDTAAPTA